MKKNIVFKISEKMLSEKSIENTLKRVIEANLENLDMDALFTRRTNENAA